MTKSNGSDTGPLWLIMEEEIAGLGSHDLAQDNLENAIQGVAKALDEAGIQASTNAGHMLDLRRAIGARVTVGRPLMKDLKAALQSLRLEDLENPYRATMELIDEIGKDWPAFRASDRRSHILEMVEETKLDLLVTKARELAGDGGIRFLIEEEIAPPVVVARMEISDDDYARVLSDVKAERAERARVRSLLKEQEGKPEADRIRHLINNDVAEELIKEMAGVNQGAIDEVNKAMEEELAEKKRLAEEEAARKAAEAAGPALEDIPPEEMLEHIEALREILEFSDVEKEIRVMCEQSGIPKALADIAVSDPDKLDELEAEAEG